MEVSNPQMQFVPVSPAMAEGFITQHYHNFIRALMMVKSSEEQTKNAILFLDTGFIWAKQAVQSTPPGALMIMQPVSESVPPPVVEAPEAA